MESASLVLLNVEFREKCTPIEYVFYKWFRCEFAHEGELPIDIEFMPDDEPSSLTVHAGGAPAFVLKLSESWFATCSEPLSNELSKIRHHDAATMSVWRTLVSWLAIRELWTRVIKGHWKPLMGGFVIAAFTRIVRERLPRTPTVTYWAWVGGACFVLALYLSWRELVVTLRPAIRLDVPDHASRAFHVRSDLFEVEESGEQEDGTTRFDYNDAHETWKVRVTNMSLTMLKNVQVSVRNLSPPVVSPTIGRPIEATLPLALDTLSVLHAGDSHLFDVLRHHNGSPFVSLVGASAPSFYPAESGTVVELQVLAEEGVPLTLGRVEIRRQGRHNVVTVSGVLGARPPKILDRLTSFVRMLRCGLSVR